MVSPDMMPEMPFRESPATQYIRDEIYATGVGLHERGVAGAREKEEQALRTAEILADTGDLTAWSLASEILCGISIIDRRDGNLEAADTHLTQAVACAERSGNRSAMMMVHFNRAKYFLTTERFGEAVEAFQQAEGLWRDSATRPVMHARESVHQDMLGQLAYARIQNGDVDAIGDLSGTIENLQLILEVNKTTHAETQQDIETWVTGLLFKKIDVLLEQGGKEEAFEALLQAREILNQNPEQIHRMRDWWLHALAFPEQFTEGRVWQIYEEAQMKRSNYAGRQAIIDYEGIAMFAQMQGNIPHMEGLCYQGEALAYVYLGSEEDYQHARELYARAADTFERQGELADVGAVLRDQGIWYMRRGEYAQAKAVLERSIQILHTAGNVSHRLMSEMKLALVYAAEGELGIASLRGSLALREWETIAEEDNYYFRSQSWKNWADIVHAQGDVGKERVALETALAVLIRGRESEGKYTDFLQEERNLRERLRLLP